MALQKAIVMILDNFCKVWRKLAAFGGNWRGLAEIGGVCQRTSRHILWYTANVMIVNMSSNRSSGLRYQTHVTQNSTAIPKVKAMDKNTTAKKSASDDVVQAKGSNQEVMIPKSRYDCVNLALKDIKELLKERTAENEALRLRISELEEKLECIVTIAKWFKVKVGE